VTHGNVLNARNQGEWNETLTEEIKNAFTILVGISKKEER
jgi:hypothetical protein